MELGSFNFEEVAREEAENTIDAQSRFSFPKLIPSEIARLALINLAIPDDYIKRALDVDKVLSRQQKSLVIALRRAIREYVSQSEEDRTMTRPIMDGVFALGLSEVVGINFGPPSLRAPSYANPEQGSEYHTNPSMPTNTLKVSLLFDFTLGLRDKID